MKKLTLLLAALTVASAAYAKEVMPVAEVEAAPMLKVTSIGQQVVVENTSGNEDIGEAVHLENRLGLAYGDDWTFGLMARKTWSMDTADGIKSDNHRMEMSATKHYDNYTVGAIWRAEKDYDRFLATTSYKYDMFSGNLKAGYKFVDGKNDYLYAEGMPVAVTYNNVKVGYYFEYSKYVGTNDTAIVKDGVTSYDQTSGMLHQIRVSTPLYSNDKLSLAAEYRYQFAEDKDYEKTNDKGWQEKNRHIAILSGSYAMTDNLSISSYYEYDFNKYDGHDGAKDNADNYYGEFGLGWTYKF